MVLAPPAAGEGDDAGKEMEPGAERDDESDLRSR